MVFVIRCVPDIFTGEILNVGVCAVDNTGKRKAKVITEAGRLHCLYGNASDNVVLLAQAALHAAEGGHPSPSAQIVFDTPTPYYNSTLSDILDNTFDDQVTVALPHKPTNNPSQISDEVAVQKILDIIKHKHPLDTAFIANTPRLLLDTDQGPRPMYIPLQPSRGVGTIRSATYSADSLKVHLLDSVLDMQAAQVYRKKESAALFILSPKSNNKKKDDEVDRTIDAIAWRCSRGTRIVVEPTAEELAVQVESWAAEFA